MIGVDHPHPEMAPPLCGAVDRFVATPGVTEAGARRVICGNAAQPYGIDLVALQPHIDRIGFELRTEAG